MTEPVQRHAWFWRRILTYTGFTTLMGIAIVGVFRSPDPQWIAIAAIVSGWLMHTVYVTSATIEDITRLTQAFAQGIQAAKGDG